MPDPVRPAAKTRATTPVHAGHGLPGAQGAGASPPPVKTRATTPVHAGHGLPGAQGCRTQSAPLPKPGRPHLCMPATGCLGPRGAGPSPPRCQNQGDHTCACRPRAAWGPGVPERVLPLSKPGRPHLCMPATGCLGPRGAGPSPPRCQNQGDHTCACRPRAAWGPGVPERVLPAVKTRATTPVHAGHGLPGAQGCRSESSPCQNQGDHTCACRPRAAWGPGVPERVLPLSKPGRPHLCMPATGCLGPRGAGASPPPVKTRATTPVHAGHGLPGAQGCRSESSPCQWW